MAKQYTPAQIRATQAQRRELSLMAFEHFCHMQQERILRTFTNTVTDTDLPMEQVEARWRTSRLGPVLHSPDYFTDDNPDNIHMEVRK